MSFIELDHLEQQIQRQKRYERQKSARDPNLVRAEMISRQIAYAQLLGLSIEALDNLLSDPDSYRKFLKLTNGKGFND